MSRPVHFEELPDGQWLASCRRCPRSSRAFARTQSFADANDWWKDHRETPEHYVYSGEKGVPEDAGSVSSAALAEIFGVDVSAFARRGLHTKEPENGDSTRWSCACGSEFKTTSKALGHSRHFRGDPQHRMRRTVETA